MPELPEVETITRDLNKELAGKTIKRILVQKDYKTTPEPTEFVKTLANQTIKEVTRIAKVIVFSFEKGDIHLTFHLAMTGRLLYTVSPSLAIISNTAYKKQTSTTTDARKLKLLLQNGSKEPHIKIKIVFSEDAEVTFSDVRMFGYARILNQQDLEKLHKKYGPTPFHPELTPERLIQILSSRKTQIKRALLEQELVAGLGNIYANDSLWLSKIHPERLTTSLTHQEATELLNAMKLILTEGIDHRGSTLEDMMYVDIYGNPGTHQNHFRIYGKADKSCPRCQAKIQAIQVAQRATFFCPNCQPKIKTPLL